MAVDLHLHTSASDGSLTPEQLVNKAIKLEYDAISITDHDTVSGIEPAISAAAKTSLEVIPGIEINTDYKGEQVHILGYYINYNNKKLLNKLNELKKMRKKRAKKIVKKLNQLGIKLKFKDVLKIAKSDVISRTHIATLLIKKDYVDSWEEAFDEYIGINSPAYVTRKKMTSVQAIKLIKKIGGKSVLAHPGLINKMDVIKEIIDMGIDGLEVFYYEHDPDQINKFKKISKKNNLIMTGGSDDHGPEKKDGMRLGKIRLNYNIVEQLKS